jgi:hypothetical protein
MVVEAKSVDALRDAARAKLEGDGYRVRSLSCGPKGLVVCVEATQ